MHDHSWSWAQASKPSFPIVDGKPKYQADKRTCVLPVKLEAGKTYVIWINSQKFGNFKDEEGHPALPYLLVFKTKKSRGRPDRQSPRHGENNDGVLPEGRVVGFAVDAVIHVQLLGRARRGSPPKAAE